MYLTETACCGVLEITELSENRGPKEACEQMVLERSWQPTKWDPVKATYINSKPKFEGLGAAHVTFTEAIGKGYNSRRYGTALKKFIEANKLGEVVQTRLRVNPNHSEANEGKGRAHKVRLFVWTVDHKRFKQFAAKVLKDAKKEKKSGIFDDDDNLFV
jgi:hypothetical protein